MCLLIGENMVRIPSGVFVMGSPEDEEDTYNERPQHIVSVPEFKLGKYPVTQAQWREVSSWNSIEKELDPDPSKFKGKNRPVEQVSWDDAQEFCARLSRETGNRYRLPTEAEWEYACRAVRLESVKSIEEWNKRYNHRFSYGETLTTDISNYDGFYFNKGNIKEQCREETTEVGIFPANSFGLHDMHGNVWEWCEDDYHKNYDGAPPDGSAWLKDGKEYIDMKILRGGSWGDYLVFCTSANRYGDFYNYKDYYTGFRVAL